MRILITGASGSGTSTLAKGLAERFACAHIEADEFFWLPTDPPYTSKRDRTARLNLLSEELNEKKRFVLAGCVMGWGSELEESFDFVVFIYLPTAIRLERLERRETERHGAANPAFLDWAAQYDSGPNEGRSLAKHNAWLAQRKCHVLRIERGYCMPELLDIVTNELHASKNSVA
jgi:adenylate kinase family enzyme